MGQSLKTREIHYYCQLVLPHRFTIVNKVVNVGNIDNGVYDRQLKPLTY